MLKYELKKVFTIKKTIILFLFTIFWTALMIRNLGDSSKWGEAGAVDAFIMTNNIHNLILLCIILSFAVPIFYVEEKCNMSSVLSVSKKGKNKIHVIKMLPVFIVTELLTIVYAVSNITAWNIAFGDFGLIPLGNNELVDASIQNNPALSHSWMVLSLLIASFAFYANFLAVFSMYLSSIKIKPLNIYILSGVIMIGTLLLSIVPGVGDICGMILSRPFSTDASYIILLHIGIFSVTPKYISFMAYAIISVFLIYKTSHAYKSK